MQNGIFSVRNAYKLAMKMAVSGVRGGSSIAALLGVSGKGYGACRSHIRSVILDGEHAVKPYPLKEI